MPLDLGGAVEQPERSISAGVALWTSSLEHAVHPEAFFEGTWNNPSHYAARRELEFLPPLQHNVVVMRNAVTLFHRLVLIFSLTVALVATGYGHRMPSANDSMIDAFILSGGSLADLCADTDGDGLPDHDDCPACHIVASADLPDAGLTIHDADLAFVAKVVAPRESRAVRVVLDSARGMRAPPLA
jgi:hypothetical protein